ncbi:MAG TPA: hypothetical protein VLE46_08550 [Nitrospira sp.]|nr:hypothetical protein [Nitrospira sp.]
MSIIYYFIAVMGLVVGLAGTHDSLVSAKSLEAGYVSTSWMGSGEVHDLPDGEQVINAIVKGVMIVRHSNGAVGGIVHTAQLECPIRVTLSTKNNHRTYLGLCTILAHEGKDVGYAEWKCSGDHVECEGEFTFTGGAGGFSGISGTTPFFSRIVFEKLEAQHARAVGYAYWPNLTVALP